MTSSLRYDDPRLAYHDEAHAYWLDGKPVRSVTQMLKYIEPDFARFYTPESAARGRRVHQMVEYDLDGILDIGALDDETLEYYEQWQDFRIKTAFEPELCEQRVYSQSFWFAGTLDLYGLLRGIPSLIDIKSGAVTAAAGPQTAAYKSAAVEMELIPATARRFVLDLKPGRWSLSPEYTDAQDKSIFLACAKISNWMEQTK